MSLRAEILPGDIVYQSTLFLVAHSVQIVLISTVDERKIGLLRRGKNGLASPTAGILFTFYVAKRFFETIHKWKYHMGYPEPSMSNPPSRIDHAEFGFNTGSPARFKNWQIFTNSKQRWKWAVRRTFLLLLLARK